jgi:hypothetical protein
MRPDPFLRWELLLIVVAALMILLLVYLISAR